MIQRGKFIVLEGLDRSGKSSVSQYISQWLSMTKKTIRMGFPDRTTPIGKMINEFLTNKTELSQEAIHLLFSANRWENMKRINQNLQAGTNIVCDRYWYSGVAYSVAKGMNEEWCISPDRGLIEPDLIIYLKSDPQVLSKRANYGQQRYEKLDFQKKVKASFQSLFEKQTNQNILKTIEVGEMNLAEVKQVVKSILEKTIL